MLPLRPQLRAPYRFARRVNDLLRKQTFSGEDRVEFSTALWRK